MSALTELVLAKNRLQLAGIELSDSGHKELFDRNCELLAELMIHLRETERVVNKVER